MTLKDILEVSCSDVSIMKNIFPMITIFHTATRDDYINLLDQHTLNSEIEKMDIYDNRIRIWLIKEKSDVTRCKDCKYYISGEDMKNNEMYKDYNNVLGHDGLCMNTNKWTDEIDFCSDGKNKED